MLEQPPLTEWDLMQIEKCYSGSHGSPDRATVIRLIGEIRRLRKELGIKASRRRMPEQRDVVQCRFIRTVGGQPHQCTAAQGMAIFVAATAIEASRLAQQ